MIKWILTKIVGTKNQREVRRLRPIVEQIVSIEESWNGKGQESCLRKRGNGKGTSIASSPWICPRAHCGSRAQGRAGGNSRQTERPF
ncbi:MAG: hypothetical protein ACLT38_12955 [Akkermansia sp.]